MKFFLEDYDVFDLTMRCEHDTPAYPSGLTDLSLRREMKRSTHYINDHVLTMSCHCGTHLDGPRHTQPRGEFISELALKGRLIGEGVIVDLSHKAEDFSFFDKNDILNAGVEVKKGDILVINTGYHKYQPGQIEEDEVKYFFRHPGPKHGFAEWCLEMKFNYLGIDGGTMDHPFDGPMNGRQYMEDLAFCRKYGIKSVEEMFPRETILPMHKIFAQGIIHMENLGGDIDKCLNKRCIIATLPLKIVAESAPCRVVAFVKK